MQTPSGTDIGFNKNRNKRSSTSVDVILYFRSKPLSYGINNQKKIETEEQHFSYKKNHALDLSSF